MSKAVVLNNVDHKDLRIITRKAAEFGDNVNGALVFPAEFLQVHKEYPIYFQKASDTGEFQAVALFGFEPDQNLFLDGSGWNARYIPALIRREPFLIGFQKSSAGPQDQKAVLLVDMGSPRISKSTDGELVFKENGGNTTFLEDANNALSIVHEGLAAAKLMFSTFLSLDLIEPFLLDIKFNDATEYKTNMFYTINQEKLRALPDDVVGKLNQNGLLQIAYMVTESLSNIRVLIEKRNKLG